MDSTQPGSQRIAFDVPVNHEEVFVVLNRKALVPLLINVPQSAGVVVASAFPSKPGKQHPTPPLHPNKKA